MIEVFSMATMAQQQLKEKLKPMNRRIAAAAAALVIPQYYNANRQCQNNKTKS